MFLNLSKKKKKKIKKEKEKQGKQNKEKINTVNSSAIRAHPMMNIIRDNGRLARFLTSA